MNEQDDFKKFVKTYFNNLHIGLSDDLYIFYTPDMEGTNCEDRVLVSLALKVNGEWIPNGLAKRPAPLHCFVGDYKMGYYTSTWHFLRIEQVDRKVELGDYLCRAVPKRTIIESAIGVTRFEQCRI